MKKLYSKLNTTVQKPDRAPLGLLLHFLRRRNPERGTEGPPSFGCLHFRQEHVGRLGV